jgi:small subunit ribosomal protein S8e
MQTRGVTFAVVSGATRKTRIIDVVYNASNNELVRTKTLVKNAILVVDATPFRQWYESHYILPLGRKKGAKLVSCIREQNNNTFIYLYVYISGTNTAQINRGIEYRFSIPLSFFPGIEYRY